MLSRVMEPPLTYICRCTKMVKLLDLLNYISCLWWRFLLFLYSCERFVEKGITLQMTLIKEQENWNDNIEKKSDV